MHTLRLLWELGRFHRPIGVWLILFPAIWGLLIGAPEWPSLRLIIMFIIGSFLIRSLGCTINDILDRQFDAQVQRTANRPLANGQLTLNQAIAFLIFQTIISVILALQLDFDTFMLALVGGAMTLIYPMLKRWTHWPQLWLGFIMNWGLLMGLVAQQQSINFAGLILYIGSVFWTLGYDTIYAFQDIHDDKKIGLKSSAIMVQNYGKQFIYFCYTIFFASIFLTCYFTHLVGWLYSLPILIVIYHGYRLYQLDLHDINDCYRAFISNQYLAFFITILFFAKTLLKTN